MRDDPVTEGLRWLDQARADLKWAERLAEDGGYHLACFLAQQIVEKALKAFLYARGEEVVLGHSVERLCVSAARYDAALAERAKRWTHLDGYYITTRYPNGLPAGIPADVFTRDAAAGAVEIARESVEFVGTLVMPR